MEKRKLPCFENEAEEAQWWYDHRHELADEMIKAMREGRTGPGAVARWREKFGGKQAVQPEGSPTATIAESNL